MSTFKCKMCGGTLEIQSGSSVAECEYCGAKQTLPKLDDEKRANLYDRANHFRRNNEFDKASAIYEQILDEDTTDAEAYWSLVLCRYGIEYVKDPLSHRRVPTVHRTQFTSIFDDSNYKSALKNADSYQRIIYEEEAKAINEIQKGILAISGQEEPFDVFICYKETDESGRRTHDSVLAQDLYSQLTREGLKVFFSRITLEDKLGTAYEPYIFAALTSAPVMVVIGTRPEHFNAVWVKNEWSRYLSLIKLGERKVLIPAFKDMDPYNLPIEFSHLQAQDMSKLGFMQDLVRGIKKILGYDKPPVAPQVTERVVVQETATIQDAAPLLRRAFLFLEDGEYDAADEYAEKVLDINPECAEAYTVKLLIDLGLYKLEDLAHYHAPFASSGDYQKILRFATPEYRATIEGYNNAIIERIETSLKDEAYDNGIQLMKSASYGKAIEYFSKILSYKDAAQKIEECKALEESDRLYTIYSRAQHLFKNNDFDTAATLFATIPDYEDSSDMVVICGEKKEYARKDKIYRDALDRVTTRHASDVDLKSGIAALESISGFKDADDQVWILKARLDQWYEAQRQAEEDEKRRRALYKAKARKVKLITLISVCAVLVIALIIGVIFVSIKYSIEYDLAGGFIDEDSKRHYTYLTDDFSLSTPTRIGYTFNGWTGTGISSYPSVNVKIEKFSTGDRHYTANWVPNTYTVTLDNTTNLSTIKVTLDYNYVGSTPTVVSLKNGEILSYPEPPTRSGYAFAGWYTDTSYTTMYSFTGTLSEDITLYAMWKPMVSYYTSEEYIDIADYADDSNRMYFSDITASTSSYAHYYYFTIYKTGSYTFNAVHSAGDFCISAYNVSKNSYVMSNTNLYSGNSNESSYFSAIAGDVIYVSIYNYSSTPSTNGSGYFYVSGASYPASTATANCSDKNVYAYDDTLSETLTVEYDASFTLPTPTRYGYTFAGWFDGDTKVENGTWVHLSDVTLTALWSVGGNTITLDANGGTVSTNSISVVFDNEFTLPTPKKTGYTFLGWYDGKTLYESGIWNKTDDVTLVAKWQINEYTVTFKDIAEAGVKITYNHNYTGAPNSSVTFNTGDKISRSTDPTRSNYIFTGWYTDSACTERYDFTGTVTTDMTLYAGWVSMSLIPANTYNKVDPTLYISSIQTLDVQRYDSYTTCIYIVAEESGTHTVYYKNSYNNISYGYNVKINNLTTRTVIQPDTLVYATAYQSYTFTCSAGDVIAISCSRYKSSYSSYLSFYFGGFGSAPSTYAEIASSKFSYSKGSVYRDTVTYGENYVLPTPTREGYTFVGWYNGSTRVESGDWSIPSSVTLTPMWTES